MGQHTYAQHTICHRHVPHGSRGPHTFYNLSIGIAFLPYKLILRPPNHECFPMPLLYAYIYSKYGSRKNWQIKVGLLLGTSLVNLYRLYDILSLHYIILASLSEPHTSETFMQCIAFDGHRVHATMNGWHILLSLLGSV